WDPADRDPAGLERARGAGPAGAGGERHVGGEMGNADTPEPTTEREPPETDQTLKDAGEPAEGTADPEGSSGAEEGLSPWAPESYDADAAGPPPSTDDS